MPEKIPRLPDAELEVMKVIWNKETPISTSQVKEYLDQKRPWNISALQTLLNRLIDRGFLSSTKEGKQRFYQPLMDENTYLIHENKSFLERLNGNSLTKFVTTLYDSKSITKKDLEELATFLAKKTEEN